MSDLVADSVVVTLGGARVLDGVGARLRRGRITALLGPNGAGKSTLLACLAGLRIPQEGSVSLGDEQVTTMARQRRARRIGLLPQAQDVHWDVDVETLVGLGRMPWQGRWGASAADRGAIEQAMAATDVAHLRGRGVERLSGGERSRVLLARVLAGEPQWLLVDEPLASLDPAHQMGVLGVLREAAEAGAGVVLVVHDLNLARRAADDVILLRSGRVVASGTAAAVLSEAPIAAAYDVAVEVGCSPGGVNYILPR